MARKILIVGQEPALREVLSEILDTEGFEPLIADGISAVEALVREQAISTILADFDGSHCYDMVRDPLTHLHNVAPDVPIVLCTAHPGTSEMDLKRYGVAFIITMPFEIEELLRVLQRIVRPGFTDPRLP